MYKDNESMRQHGDSVSVIEGFVLTAARNQRNVAGKLVYVKLGQWVLEGGPQLPLMRMRDRKVHTVRL